MKRVSLIFLGMGVMALIIGVVLTTTQTERNLNDTTRFYALSAAWISIACYLKK